MKTRKAVLKRIKVTGRKKLLKRPLCQGHFNAKESGNKTRRKRKETRASKADEKIIRKALPYI